MDTTARGSRLSLQQERLWSFLHDDTTRLLPHPYTQGAFLLEGQLNEPYLLQAFNETLSRHEILRTLFYSLPGMDMPLQIVSDVPFYTYTSLSASEYTGTLSELLDEQFAQLASAPCDLERGPLLHLRLVTLDQARSILFVNIHALCADASTLKHLLSAVNLVYTRLEGETGPDEEDEPLQYADVSAWQNELLGEDGASLRRAFWQKHDLSALSTFSLPLEEKAPAELSFSPSFQQVPLAEELHQRLATLARTTSASSEAILLACWYVLLWRLGTNAPLTIGLACDGRNYEDLANVPGLYTRQVPFSTSIDQHMPFTQFISQVHIALEEAKKWQQYFTWEESASGQAPPAFPVAFAFTEWPESFSTPSLRCSLLAQRSLMEPATLTLSVLQYQPSQASQVPGFTFQLIANANRLSPVAVQNIVSVLQTLVEQALAHPETTLGALPLLTAARQQQLLRLGQGPVRPRPTTSLIERFQQQVQAHSDALALVAPDATLSYAQLNAQANRLAALLQARGVGPASFVALLFPRCSQFLVALLATLKLGACSVPLEPRTPPARLRAQLARLPLTLLLSLQELQPRRVLPEEAPCPAVCLDEAAIQEALAQASPQDHDPVVRAGGQGLAYVIATSGSTGTPKAVLIEEASVLNYTLGLLEELELAGGLHFATASTWAADLGNTCVFAALLSGGCLHVLDYETATSAHRWLAYTQRWPLDVLKLVPSHLQSLLTACPPAQRSQLVPRRCLILGGERLPLALLERLREVGASCEVVNHYGPTETTIGVLTHRFGSLRPGQEVPRRAPLGRPLANVRVTVRDERGELVPLGVEGELVIGGAGLARGYWEEPVQTGQRFGPEEGGPAGSRCYHTGDRVRMNEAGELEFVGRQDGQVKLRGYRIELGEIEAQLNRVEGVRGSVVRVVSRGEGQEHLVGYVVSEREGAVTVGQVREELGRVLPEYMVPAELLFLPRFPLTPNGKLDTRLLPEPASSQGGQEQRDRQTFIKPRDAIEARLYDIWTELLRLSRVSVLDNFFELGGNSLIAVRLMSRIQQHFGQDLPLTMLFKYPTIEGLATILRQQSQPQEGQNILVPLQPQGSLLPFFCVHPAGGTVFSYQALARHLGADRPFYGLQSPDTEASGTTGASLEELATYYVAAIQNAQPHGPYHLGGWSLGGVIAFEIAQQLLQAGEEVAFLALLDSSVPISFYRQNGAEATTPVAGAREEIGDGELAAAMIAEGTVAQPDEEFAQLSSREKLTYVWEQARANHSIPHDTSFEQFRRISRMQYTNIRAVGRYIPRSYPGRITLFRSSESLQAPDGLYDEMTARRLQPDGGWDELTTDQVEVHIVPGSHHDMVDEPHVRVLAEVLKGCLETSRKNL